MPSSSSLYRRVRKTFSLDPTLVEACERQAKRQGMALSQWVEEAMLKSLPSDEEKKGKPRGK